MSVYDRWHTSKPRLNESGDPVTRCKEHKQYPGTDHGQGDRWQVRWRDENKKQCKQNFPKKGGSDPDTCADAFDAKIKDQLNSGTYVDPAAGRITLEEFAKRWRSGLTGSLSTIENIDKRLAPIYDVEAGPKSRRAPGKSVIGKQPMAALAKRPSVIQQWIKSLEAKGLAPGYIKLILDTLSSIFIAAIDDGIVHRNPTKATSVNPPKVVRKRIVPWTLTQVDAAAESLGERSAAMVYLGTGAGLRQGEIFGIAGEDIEFLGRERMIHVRRQVQLVKGHLVFSLPKGDKVRDIPMSSVLALRLSAQIKACAPVEVTLPWKEPGGKPHTATLLFVRPDGRPHHRQTFTYTWHKARKAAGAEPTPENGMHILRHTAASAWLAGGVDIRTLADWLGHEDPGFTLRTYTHLMPNAADKGRKAMDAFLNPAEDKIIEQSARNVPSDGSS